MSVVVPRFPLSAAITKLGYTGNLKLLLDAGDGSSYTSGQKWLDLSGGGHDFFLGTSASAEPTADPVFNGQAGQASASEFWSGASAAQFTYDTTNESWMQNFHKAGCVMSGMAWVYKGNVGANLALCGTAAGLAGFGGVTGFFWRVTAGLPAGIGWYVSNGSSQVMTNNDTASNIAANRWHFLGVRVDVPNSTLTHYVNDTKITTAPFTYTSPSAGNSGYAFQVAARGNGQAPLATTDRMASLALWDGVALPDSAFDAVFYTTRAKYGV